MILVILEEKREMTEILNAEKQRKIADFEDNRNVNPFPIHPIYPIIKHGRQLVWSFFKKHDFPLPREKDL